MEDARGYLLSNWMAAKLRLSNNEGVIGSSTEGHVSHILSKRMSSSQGGGVKKVQVMSHSYVCMRKMVEIC